MMSSSPPHLTTWSRDSLLAERSSHAVINTALTNALDLMILGYISEANRIISSLYTNDALQFENSRGRAMGMYSAWSHSNLFPSFILNPDPNKPSVVCRLLPGGQKPEAGDLSWMEAMENEFREERWPGWLKEKWPKLGKEDLEKVLKEANYDESQVVGRGEEPRITVFAAVEVALAVGEHEQAESLIRKYVTPRFRKLHTGDSPDLRPNAAQEIESRQRIAESRQAWELLCQKIVADELGIDEKAVAEYVDEEFELLEERFTKGPTRLYSDQSIPELMKMLDESYMAMRKADPTAGGNMAIPDFDVANIPPTFIKEGATDEAIQELREKLGEDETLFELPKDYEDFLRVSNGFYVTEPDDQTGIFYGTSAVGWDETASDSGAKVELLPYMYTCIDLMDEFDWPEARALSLGAGGDEGAIWLIDPKSLKEALEEFERIYAAAPEKNKRIYERAAKDLYGGLEEMRQLEWLVITWYHWNPDPEPYGGFRAYLEYTTDEAVKMRKKEEAAEERGTKRKFEGTSDEDDGEDDKDSFDSAGTNTEDGEGSESS